ncbi:unnamed protein product [Sphenostylis stenocarpa]|uniref:Uncharacterized protein n=1 Tax=Sphenostylis stenocarpa TaxID=92480 RepID=A0AA86S0H6_9FABA|nr:unnamed protein product [Sphenostylis stenocarpa]
MSAKKIERNKMMHDASYQIVAPYFGSMISGPHGGLKDKNPNHQPTKFHKYHCCDSDMWHVRRMRQDLKPYREGHALRVELLEIRFFEETKDMPHKFKLTLHASKPRKEEERENVRNFFARNSEYTKRRHNNTKHKQLSRLSLQTFTNFFTGLTQRAFIAKCECMMSSSSIFAFGFSKRRMRVLSLPFVVLFACCIGFRLGFGDGVFQFCRTDCCGLVLLLLVIYFGICDFHRGSAFENNNWDE